MTFLEVALHNGIIVSLVDHRWRIGGSEKDKGNGLFAEAFRGVNLLFELDAVHTGKVHITKNQEGALYRGEQKVKSLVAVVEEVKGMPYVQGLKDFAQNLLVIFVVFNNDDWFLVSHAE